MAKDERRSDDDLAAAIERTRTDSQFMERLGLLVESDREILDRLAGGEPPT